MGGQNDWRPVVTGGDWMRNLEKRVMHEERRRPALSRMQLLGPGLGPLSMELKDWNDDAACFNGMYWSEPGSLNSPNGLKWWMGKTQGDVSGSGLQTVWAYGESPTTQWNRTFYTNDDGSRTYRAWEQAVGTGGSGTPGPPGDPGADGSRWYSMAGPPTINSPGEPGDFYLDTTTGDYYIKVNQGGGVEDWVYLGNLRGPQGSSGPAGPPGPPGPGVDEVWIGSNPPDPVGVHEIWVDISKQPPVIMVELPSGEWVPASSAAADEVWIGDTEPTDDNIELWYDSDATAFGVIDEVWVGDQAPRDAATELWYDTDATPSGGGGGGGTSPDYADLLHRIEHLEARWLDS